MKYNFTTKKFRMTLNIRYESMMVTWCLGPIIVRHTMISSSQISYENVDIW